MSWTSCALPHTDCVISADFCAQNIDVFSNPSVFYLCFIDAQYLPVDDQDRSKHVAVMTDYVQNVILTSVLLLVLLCELFVNART
jgi:hypothetical protein